MLVCMSLRPKEDMLILEIRDRRLQGEIKVFLSNDFTLHRLRMNIQGQNQLHAVQFQMH